MGEVIDINDRLDEEKHREAVGFGIVAAIMAKERLGPTTDFKSDLEALEGLGLVHNGLPQEYIDLLRYAGVEIVTPVGKCSRAV